MLTAIRAELLENFTRHDRASAFNSEMADFLWNEGQKGVEFVPESAYPSGSGIVRGSSLTSAAWATAQNDAALSDVPVETVLKLARVYEAQRIYVDDHTTLLNNLYALLLGADNVDIRMDGTAQPGRLGGVLRDYAGRGRQLNDLYRATLLDLGVDPATLAPGPEPVAAAPTPAAAQPAIPAPAPP